MPYKLTYHAEEDLRDIAIYTLDNWGKSFLIKYQKGLKQLFESVADGAVVGKTFSRNYPELLVTSYRYHKVFYFLRAEGVVEIIGVIHERRNIVKCLRQRTNY